ncbi:MAG: DUF308 domain-containing protein [Prevotellaceae bacterium]|jgi:uncharacterized membrane protein HdeD (DUF308 family)|nr:DUF308 domain-containing protein [Prevotellaceae bacterium]
MNNSIMRIICACIIGLVLVVWPDFAAKYLVITLGILFLIPGLAGLIRYFSHPTSTSKQLDWILPLAAGGSTLFGLVLLILPDFFANAIMLLLGAILLLAGSQQLYQIIAVRKSIPLPVAFYVMPTLILLAGLLILLHPIGTRHTLSIIVGCTFIIYAATELVKYVRLK